MKRLVTRSDFDGLVCAMLLRELDIIGEIKFVHPKDVQDGKIELSDNDITTNLPFDARVSLAFDHHESELSRVDPELAKDKFIIDGDAKSAARVVYDYDVLYGYFRHGTIRSNSVFCVRRRRIARFSQHLADESAF